MLLKMLFFVFFLQNTDGSTIDNRYCMKKPKNRKRMEKLWLHTMGFTDVHEHTEGQFTVVKYMSVCVCIYLKASEKWGCPKSAPLCVTSFEQSEVRHATARLVTRLQAFLKMPTLLRFKFGHIMPHPLAALTKCVSSLLKNQTLTQMNFKLYCKILIE